MVVVGTPLGELGEVEFAFEELVAYSYSIPGAM